MFDYRSSQTAVRERVDVGQRVAIGLITLSLSLLSLALGLAFLQSPGSLLILTPAVPNVRAATSATAATLTWTAPGDDGTVGQATTYNLRYSTVPMTVLNFDAATAATGVPAPQPAGTTETFTVTNLQSNTTYYFGLRTIDEAGNVSALSNIATITTADLAQACIPEYTCSAWSACTNGTQTRTCSVTNGCPGGLGQPIGSQTCANPATGGLALTIRNPIVAVGVGPGAIPTVRTLNPSTRRVNKEFLVFGRATRNGMDVATGDVDKDGNADVVVGSGIGSDPLVKWFTANGTFKAEFNPYPASHGTGVNVAVDDINGDGQDDVLTLPAKGPAQLRIYTYDLKTKKFSAYYQTFLSTTTVRTGFTMATGDLNLDGRAEIILTPQKDARYLEIYSWTAGNKLSRLSRFAPYTITFTSGLSVTTADYNGDGRAEIATVPGPGYYADVKLFTLSGRLLTHFLPTTTSNRNGFELAAYNVNADGREELYLAPRGGTPAIWVYRYNTLTQKFERIQNYLAYPATMNSGLRLSATPHI